MFDSTCPPSPEIAIVACPIFPLVGYSRPRRTVKSDLWPGPLGRRSKMTGKHGASRAPEGVLKGDRLFCRLTRIVSSGDAFWHEVGLRKPVELVLKFGFLLKTKPFS